MPIAFSIAGIARSAFARRGRLKLSLWFCASLFACALRAADTPITVEQLQQLPALPTDFETQSAGERIRWLDEQLAIADSAARRYQLHRQLAFARFDQDGAKPSQQLCRQLPPLAFDWGYRYLCAETNDSDYDASLRELMALHDLAVNENDSNFAVRLLSSIAWMQSSHGDIASAFRSYEQALALAKAELADTDLLNNLMIDTATLYVMHGDRDYIQKGIALQQTALANFEALKQNNPDAARYADDSIALIQHNIGVAYALHLLDYASALNWFTKVAPESLELRRSTLVFSALAAAELNQFQQARQLLAASLQAPASTQVNTDYLLCYQQLVRLKLQEKGDLSRCEALPDATPLEVNLDLYKRMAKLEQPDWRRVGLEKMHVLFVGKLEAQLKQSATQAASLAELSRLQLESDLKSELLEKEQALKQAEQQQRKSQTLLALASGAILLLIIVAIAIRLQQNRKLARQYRALSVRDGLTGLHNRRYFEQNINRELSFVKRAQKDGSGHKLALYLFDIDHFKKINDSYGHDCGDDVIIEFARRIKTVIRETDLLVRWGGEEFLLVARLTQAEDYHAVAERLRLCCAETPFTVSNGSCLPVTCTIGATLYPEARAGTVDLPWTKLLQLADAALYLGKRSQRNCWICVDSVPAAAELDRILADELSTAIESGALIISRGPAAP